MHSDFSNNNTSLNNNKQIPVYLNIYNFWSCFNTICQPLGLGVYHTAIQIYDDQYMYFGFDGQETGIGYIEPFTASYQFAEQMLLGYTNYSFLQLDEQVLDPLRIEFIGNKYDLLANNCNHFSKRLAKQLQLDQKFPKKVFRLTNCCNIFRCCIPQCILNGRLDWFHWDRSQISSQEGGYFQLQQSVQEQYDRKILKPKQQQSISPRKNKQVPIHEKYEQHKYSHHVPPPNVDIPKDNTLRKGIWPCRQDAQQRMSHSNNENDKQPPPPHQHQIKILTLQNKDHSHKHSHHLHSSHHLHQSKKHHSNSHRYPNEEIKMYLNNSHDKKQENPIE